MEEISVVDEIEAEINEYKEEIEQLKLLANELLGDTRVLREQIEKLIREAHSKEANSLEGRLTRLEYEIYKLIDEIKSLNREDINKHVLERIEKEIENIKKHMSKIKSNIEYKIVKNITKKETVIGGKIYSSIADMPESYNLLKIGLNIDNYNEKYIQKNGKLYSSIDSLNNYKMQKDIRDRINKEMKIKDCKVLVLNTDSSISNKIIRSNAFKNFLDKNYEQLKTNKKIKDTEIEFESIDKDLYSTFHGAEIKNISVFNFIYNSYSFDSIIFFHYIPKPYLIKACISLKFGCFDDLSISNTTISVVIIFAPSFSIRFMPALNSSVSLDAHASLTTKTL